MGFMLRRTRPCAQRVDTDGIEVNIAIFSRWLEKLRFMETVQETPTASYRSSGFAQDKPNQKADVCEQGNV